MLLGGFYFVMNDILIELLVWSIWALMNIGLNIGLKRLKPQVPGKLSQREIPSLACDFRILLKFLIFFCFLQQEEISATTSICSKIGGPAFVSG